MSRLIDADELIRKIDPIIEAENQIYRRESWGFAVKCRDAIEEMPTIEPQHKTGEWIPKSESGCIIECSSCGERMTVLGDENPNFCPYCGSYNGGESDDIPIEYFESGGK